MTGARTEAGTDRVTTTRATAPAALLTDAAYIAVSIRTTHPDFPAQARPVHVWFRRDGATWGGAGR